MRFRFSEFAPSNKRQYLLALGVRDIEIMLGLVSRAAESMPRLTRLSNPQYDEVRVRIKSMEKALTSALAEANRLLDDGDRRAPWGTFTE